MSNLLVQNNNILVIQLSIICKSVLVLKYSKLWSIEGSSSHILFGMHRQSGIVSPQPRQFKLIGSSGGQHGSELGFMWRCCVQLYIGPI